MTYQIGDPNHLGVHNDLVASIRSAANRAGVTVTLPDEAHLGDTGHVADHNLLAAALAEIAAKGGGMNWAKVSGGTVTEVTNADGSVDEIHTFTADSTLTVDTPGYARCLLVGGGSNGTPAGGFAAYGKCGDVREGLYSLPAGTHAVTVGAPGDGTNSPNVSSFGRVSKIGNVLSTTVATWGEVETGAGADGTANPDNRGFSSDITGTRLEYAPGLSGVTGRPGRPGQNGSGATAGIVIVRVQKTPPTVSGVAATGGTVTEFVGDGTNGVAGQRYRVHTFTANGNLTVSQGGRARAFLIGGGCGGWSGQVGGGGDVWEGDIDLTPGTVPVVVGAAGTANPVTQMGRAGGASSVGGVSTRVTNGTTGAGATVSAPDTGVTSAIDGTAKVYGRGNQTSPVANRGEGHASANGTAGVVIVRYEIA